MSWSMSVYFHKPYDVKASPATAASVARSTLTEKQTTHSVELGKV